MPTGSEHRGAVESSSGGWPWRAYHWRWPRWRARPRPSTATPTTGPTRTSRRRPTWCDRTASPPAFPDLSRSSFTALAPAAAPSCVAPARNPLATRTRQDTTLTHADIAWNFDKFGIDPAEDFKYGREPDHLRRRRLKEKTDFEASERRHLQGGSVGPPPVHLGYNPPLVWNQRMFFLLNNYQEAIPHSYNIPEQYFRSEACE